MGKLGCWGENTHGQVDVGDDLSLETFEVSAGNWHTCAIGVISVAKCYGLNSHGQTSVPKDLSNN